MALTLHGNNGLGTTNGTAAAPSIAAPDNDTGFFFGTNLIKASTGGTERLHIRPTGQVEFKGGTFTDNVDCIMANGGHMEIGGQSSIKFRTATNERFRIDSNGNANFGLEKAVALPAGTGIQVYHSSDPRIKLVNNTTGNAAGDGFQLYMSGGGVILDNKEDAEMRFYTDATEKLRITKDGHIIAGGQGSTIAFNNVGNDSFGSVIEIDGSHTINHHGMLSIVGKSDTNTNVVGRIQFINSQNSSGSSGSNAGSKNLASIEGRLTTTDSNAGDDCGGYLRFVTKADGGANAEAMRLDSAGNLSLAADTDTYIHHPAANQLAITVNGGSTPIIRFGTGGNGATVGLNTATNMVTNGEILSVKGYSSFLSVNKDYAAIYLGSEGNTANNSNMLLGFHDGSGVRGAIGYTKNTGELRFNNQYYITFTTGAAALGGDERARITATGELLVGGHSSRLQTYSSSGGTLISSYNSGANAGGIELGGNTNNNGFNAGSIFFVNNTNSDATTIGAAGSKIVGMIRAEVQTSDSNAGDDSGADLTFLTKLEAAQGTEKLRIKGTGEVQIATRNSGSGGDLAFKLGSFGIRTQDTGGYNYWHIDRNYGGWQSSMISLKADGKIGIGVAQPAYQLDIKGDSGVFVASSSTNAAGQLSIVGTNSSGTQTCISRIQSIHSGGSDNGSSLLFYTRSDVSSYPITERSRIQHNGHVTGCFAGKRNYNIDLPNNTGYVYAFTVHSSYLCSQVKVHIRGTRNSVVFNGWFDILSTHAAPQYHVRSYGCNYTNITMKLVGNNYGSYNAYFKRAGGTGTCDARIDVFPQAEELVDQTEDSGYTSTAFEVNAFNGMKIHSSTTGNADLDVHGSITGASKNFKIPHPLHTLKDTKKLVHASIEGPSCDLIYRGTATLSSGSVTVDLDAVSDMTAGTFSLLNKNVQCFTTNESGWGAVKGSVSGSILTITAQDGSSTDNVSWMVVGQRQDATVKELDITDVNGDLIIEPPINPVETSVSDTYPSNPDQYNTP